MTDMQIAEVATVTQIYTCDTHALNKLWELSKYHFIYARGDIADN
jgi:hypothetical protein